MLSNQIFCNSSKWTEIGVDSCSVALIATESVSIALLWLLLPQKSVSDMVSEGWVTPRAEWLPVIGQGWSDFPGCTVTPHQTSRYSVLQSHLDVLWSTLDRCRVSRETCTCQGHIKRRQCWDYKIRKLTIWHYSVGEVWVRLKSIFYAASMPRVKKQICEENIQTTSRLRLESCTTENVLPKVRNHGRYAQEVSRRRTRILESYHAGPTESNLAVLYKIFCWAVSSLQYWYCKHCK